MQVTIEIKRNTFDNIVEKLLDEKKLQLGNPMFINTKVRIAIEEAIEEMFGKNKS